MNRLILGLVLVFIALFFFLCAGSENEGDVVIEYPIKNSVSSDCQKVVNEFEGEIVEGLVGVFVVTGNEPFTMLKFKTEKTEDKEQEIYRVIKQCSAELWDLQGIRLNINGKVKEAFLETVTGRKMKILTLYPTLIKKIGDFL